MFVKVIKAYQDKFQKYGQLVMLPDVPMPLGPREIQFWPRLARYHIEGETEVGICRCFERRRRIENLERHKETPEILISVDGDFLIPIAPANQAENENGRLAVRKIQILHIPSGVAVILARGIWHWAVWPHRRKSVTYQVIFKLGTPTADCEKRDLVEPVEF